MTPRPPATPDTGKPEGGSGVVEWALLAVAAIGAIAFLVWTFPG